MTTTERVRANNTPYPAGMMDRMALFAAIPILYGITRLWLAKRGAGHPNLPQPESV